MHYLGVTVFVEYSSEWFVVQLNLLFLPALFNIPHAGWAAKWVLVNREPLTFGHGSRINMNKRCPTETPQIPKTIPFQSSMAGSAVSIEGHFRANPPHQNH
jgi:hypothetical protein